MYGQLFFLTANVFFAQDSIVKILVNIDHRSGDLLTINTDRKNPKKIKINQDGFFNDTLKVKPGMYQMFDGTKYVEMFLKSGYDLTITYDTEQIDKTLVFSGVGEAENKYMVNSYILGNKNVVLFGYIHQYLRPKKTIILKISSLFIL